MITFKADSEKFDRAMKQLAAQINVSTEKFVRVESKLTQEALVAVFTPKLDKSKRGIVFDRNDAYRKFEYGVSQIPWSRVQSVINRQRAVGRKPLVQIAVAIASLKKAQADLGTLAAGFIGKGNKLGASKAKGFVMGRVSKCFGDVTLMFGLLSKAIRIRNNTPWIENMRGAEFLVSKALRKRTAAMKSTAVRMAKGLPTYWDKYK